MDGEEWRVLDDYPKYAISNSGRVMNRRTEKLLSDARLDKDGYPLVYLYGESGQACNKKPHRLVIETFDEPIPFGMEINHINGVKIDNRRTNLEITDHPANLQHAYDSGLHSNIRPVCCIETEECFPSMSAAARDMGLSVSSISNVVAGIRPSVKGFHFESSPKEVNACGVDGST